jgi:transposase
MTRRKFSREFKREAVNLVTERGVSIAQAARDLDLHQTVLGRWVRDFEQNAQGAFPGHGKLTAQDEEIRRLRRENAKLKAERDILKKAAAYFAKDQA